MSLTLNTHATFFVTTRKVFMISRVVIRELTEFLFLYQVDDTEVISFLLSTEIIPLCLRTMEMGSELSKTVKFSFLILKINKH